LVERIRGRQPDRLADAPPAPRLPATGIAYRGGADRVAAEAYWIIPTWNALPRTLHRPELSEEFRVSMPIGASKLTLEDEKLRAARKKALKVLGAMDASVLAVVVWTFAIAGGSWKSFSASRREGIPRDSELRQVEPFASFLEWLDPSPPIHFLGSR
jgi:hypothetical protein